MLEIIFNFFHSSGIEISSFCWKEIHYKGGWSHCHGRLTQFSLIIFDHVTNSDGILRKQTFRRECLNVIPHKLLGRFPSKGDLFVSHNQFFQYFLVFILAWQSLWEELIDDGVHLLELAEVVDLLLPINLHQESFFYNLILCGFLLVKVFSIFDSSKLFSCLRLDLGTS